MRRGDIQGGTAASICGGRHRSRHILVCEQLAGRHTRQLHVRAARSPTQSEQAERTHKESGRY